MIPATRRLPLQELPHALPRAIRLRAFCNRKNGQAKVPPISAKAGIHKTCCWYLRNKILEHDSKLVFAHTHWSSRTAQGYVRSEKIIRPHVRSEETIRVHGQLNDALTWNLQLVGTLFKLPHTLPRAIRLRAFCNHKKLNRLAKRRRSTLRLVSTKPIADTQKTGGN